jgi:hypothetical protein
MYGFDVLTGHQRQQRQRLSGRPLHRHRREVVNRSVTSWTRKKPTKATARLPELATEFRAPAGDWA